MEGICIHINMQYALVSLKYRNSKRTRMDSSKYTIIHSSRLLFFFECSAFLCQIIRTEDIYNSDRIIAYIFLQYVGGVDEGGRVATLTWLVREEVGEVGEGGWERCGLGLGQRRACRI
jgi:hypothetical protein